MVFAPLGNGGGDPRRAARSEVPSGWQVHAKSQGIHQSRQQFRDYKVRVARKSS